VTRAAENLGFSRSDIPELTVKVLRAGEGSRPDVRLLNVDGRLLVIKDYAAGANSAKRFIGRYLVQRELAAYTQLQRLPGVPPCYGRLDPYTLVTGFVDAQPAPEVDPQRLTPDFFACLLDLVRQIHGRGVAHGDIKRLANILIDKYDRPVLVDFTAAVIIGSSPMAALVLPHIFEDDFRGVYKLKKRHAPALLTSEEEAFLEYRSLGERLFRRLRRHVREPVKKLSGREP